MRFLHTRTKRISLRMKLNAWRKKQTVEDCRRYFCLLVTSLSLFVLNSFSVVIITDKSSFRFNDCTIEEFLFQLKCRKQKVLSLSLLYFQFSLFNPMEAIVACLQKLLLLEFQLFERVATTPLMTFSRAEYLPLKCTFSWMNESFPFIPSHSLKAH